MTATISSKRSSAAVLFACFIGMMLGASSVPFYTLGTFAVPVTEGTGWTMVQYQGAFTLYLLGALFIPVFGHLCDTYGVRRVAIPSMAMFAGSLALLGWASSFGIYGFYAAWAVMAITGQGTGTIAWTHMVGGWFDRRRGLALGFVLAGSGVFAMFGPLVAAKLISQFGWQNAYPALACLVFVISMPILLLFLRDPPRLAETGAAKASPADGPVPVAQGHTLAEALSSYRFYLIGAAFLVIGFGVSGIITNLVPILAAKGLAGESAAAMAGLIGVSIIGGRLLVGAALDKFWAPAVSAILLALPAVSCLLLVSGEYTVLAVLLVGLAAGAEFDIVAFLAARYFGMAAYGKIYGLLCVAFFFGAGIAPPTFGAALDIYGDYNLILGIMAFLFVGAAASLLLLGRYPKRAEA
jgi:MFS family permease